MHSPGFGLHLSRYCHDCAESDVKQYSHILVIESSLSTFRPSCYAAFRGPPLDSQGGGGRSICRGQMIYFNRALKISHFVTCLYGTVLSKLIISRRARPKLFISKILLLPPPLGIPLVYPQDVVSKQASRTGDELIISRINLSPDLIEPVLSA